MQLSPGNRVIWLNPQGDREYKAEILQIRKTKAQILLASFEKVWTDIDSLQLVPLPWKTPGQSQQSSISTSAIEQPDIEHQNCSISTHPDSDRSFDIEQPDCDRNLDIEQPDIEHQNCSISTHLDSDRSFDIEQDDIEHSDSDRNFDIEHNPLSQPNCSISLGTYIRRRGDKEYEYWRLSWREGHRMFHRHVPNGKLNQVRQAIVAGKSRAEILLLI